MAATLDEREQAGDWQLGPRYPDLPEIPIKIGSKKVGRKRLYLYGSAEEYFGQGVWEYREYSPTSPFR